MKSSNIGPFVLSKNGWLSVNNFNINMDIVLATYGRWKMYHVIKALGDLSVYT